MHYLNVSPSSVILYTLVCRSGASTMYTFRSYLSVSFFLPLSCLFTMSTQSPMFKCVSFTHSFVVTLSLLLLFLSSMFLCYVGCFMEMSRVLSQSYYGQQPEDDATLVWTWYRWGLGIWLNRIWKEAYPVVSCTVMLYVNVNVFTWFCCFPMGLWLLVWVSEPKCISATAWHRFGHCVPFWARKKHCHVMQRVLACLWRPEFHTKYSQTD